MVEQANLKCCRGGAENDFIAFFSAKKYLNQKCPTASAIF